MKSRTKTMAVLLLMTTTAVFARDYRLNDRESIDLGGVKQVVIDLNGIHCSLCIRSVDVVADVSGDGSGSQMELRLTGNVSSNRRTAVPSLVVEKDRSQVTIRLYPRQRTYFGLSQSGNASFAAVLPISYSGDLSIRGTSGEITVHDLDLGSLEVRSSSGDIVAENLSGSAVHLEASSGEINAGTLAASGGIQVESSSGSITATYLESGEASVEASSGHIDVGEARVSQRLRLKASSGDITTSVVNANELDITTSSGDVRLGSVGSRSVSIDVSSGRIEVQELSADETRIETSDGVMIKGARGGITFDGSSGDVEIQFAEFSDDVHVEQSSGNIRIALPERSRFDARLRTSSGRISSDFRIVGEVTQDRDEITGQANGGGPTLSVETSSGNIEIQKR